MMSRRRDMLSCMTLRLALFSDQQHCANRAIDERLLRLIGVQAPLVGYVSSASDPDRTYFEACRERYAGMGVDLCCYVDELNCGSEEVLNELLACDAIHLSGGNTFSFLGWLQRSRLLYSLAAFARSGGVLIGVSAGAILMTENVDSATLCGDVKDPSVLKQQGLALVPFSFWPHFDPLNSTVSAEALAGLPSPIYACPDGSGLVVEGSSIERFGNPQVLEPRSMP
jgi:dipeptidase E